jgi:hypothetical protein
MRPRALLAAALLAAPLALGGCSAAVRSAPGCTQWERLGLVAQSVPSTSYVPCVLTTPPGWHTDQLSVRDGATTFALVSDRAAGHAVDVTLHRSCDPAGATPIPPRTPGGRSMLRLRSIDPRYAGTLFDVFPGGCVTYRFDFERGPHIALMAELESTVGFVPRAVLRLQLRRHLDVELGR